ncbi:hypothetical protein JCM10212_001697 [Sporobolomyces blumeae]
MDPVVDTGFDEGVNDDLVNPVQPTTKEADLFGNDGPPPELYPHGAPGQLEGAAPVPGSTDVDQLPVPPASFQLKAQDDERRADDLRQRQHADLARMVEDEDDVEGDDLFGDGGDDDDDDDDLQASPRLPSPPPLREEPDDGLTAEERAERKALEYDEEDAVDPSGQDDDDGYGASRVVHEEERIAQVPLANYAVPAGGKVWHAKLPNFLGLQSTAWDQGAWQPEDEDEAELAEASQGGDDVKPSGKGKGHLPDENVIRWRWTKDELGQVVKQSNARIVRWSDGSLSLQLGAELFDVSLALDHSAVVSRAAQPVAPSTAPIGLTPTTFDANRGHGLTYLTARHDYNRLYEAQASLEGTMTFRPSTLTSQTHKRLAGSVAARYHQKARGIKTIGLDADPEKKKLEREKAEIERHRRAKKEAQRAAGGRGSRSARKGKKATTLEGLDLSDDGDEDGQGGYADRRSQPKRGRGGPLNRTYSDDEDDEDGFLAKSDDDVEMEDGDQEEIEEAEEAIERSERRRKDRRKEREYSASDDSDKEDGGQGQGAVRRRMVVESDDE